MKNDDLLFQSLEKVKLSIHEMKDTLGGDYAYLMNSVTGPIICKVSDTGGAPSYITLTGNKITSESADNRLA